MILSLVAATLIAAASPAPTATPQPLKEITRVRSVAGICGNLVVHANGAIAAALRDDALVTRSIARLRAIDLENNVFSRRDGLNELAQVAANLADQAARGDEEVKRLREQAEHTSDPPHIAESRVFAEALGGALGRQKAIALDLGAFLRYLDYRELRDNPELSNPGPGRTDPFKPSGGPPGAGGLARPPRSPYERAGSPNAMALAAAADFEARTADVRADEARAAEHSEAAVSGCS